MTGKFHTTWGEFGGYKHPNALRYECAAMLAYGSKCSVGDQLHPRGRMDPGTYEIVGAAYREVEEKEAWCRGAEPISDVAVLSDEAEDPAHPRSSMADTGAGRVLLEEHVLFDLIDRSADFGAYKVLVLPDRIRIDSELKARIDRYVASGGRLLLTGTSGLAAGGAGFALDVGAVHEGESPFQPDYLECGEELCPVFVRSPLVMYVKSQQVRPTSGRVLAGVRRPYFNRTWRHFCSHQHAPPSELTPYAGAVEKGGILYLAHPVFTLYAAQGAVAYREYAARAIRRLLGSRDTIRTNLPSTGRLSLMRQPAEGRHVVHLLFANTVARGTATKLSPEGFVWDSRQVEVIEDLLPLRETVVELSVPHPVTRVTLEPQGREVPFERRDGRVRVVVPEFACHQMVVFQGA